MSVHAGLIRVSTQGDGDLVDLTEGVASVVQASEAQVGMACIFVPGSTAAVTTMEFEPGGVADLRALLDELIPARGDWRHNALNHDTNAHAHLRASVLGPSLSVPVAAGRLTLGTWQQIVLADFDDRPREREVTVQILA